ncbi:Variable major outer membrane lipoprotein (plasmid) [Borrelia crocidurae DOU]|uniref:Variable large protein n=1 Tax=Borrelia crocidurae DOU TaxID=1293575 RepID=W5SIV6_9SPIR|nr:Variable major outer membrane lipoprotein [Borrelia crocidurae DOU]
MLKSIINSKESDATTGVTANADVNTSALAFAKGGDADKLAKEVAKAAAAANNVKGGEKEVQGVGVIAANKLLGALEEIIKKTIKNVLEKAKEKIDEARESKTAIQ